jgi:predicted nucleotidyltransferase
LDEFDPWTPSCYDQANPAAFDGGWTIENTKSTTGDKGDTVAATQADVRKEESNPSQVRLKKRKALDLFAEHFLSSHAGRYVAKIVLFGSLQKGRLGGDSDVDLLILATEHLGEVEDAAAESALEVGMQTGESVEPLVYSLAALRHPTSYFLYHNLRVGEEIYCMDKDKLKKEESHGYRDLA